MDQNNFMDQLQDGIDWSVATVRNSFLPVPLKWLNFRKRAGKWSAAQCLDHILIVNGLYIKKLEAIPVSSKTRLDPGKNRIRHGLLGKLLLTLVDQQTTYKFPAPGSFKPREVTYDHGLVQKFIRQQDILSQWFASFRFINLNTIIISSPASRLARLNLADAFQLIIVHQKRHIYQALESLHLAKKKDGNR